MSDFDSRSSYESYSSGSISSKSLPTPGELMMQQQYEEIKKDIPDHFESTGNIEVFHRSCLLLNNDNSATNNEIAQESSEQYQESSTENTNSAANNEIVQESSEQHHESSAENTNYSAANNEIAQESSLIDKRNKYIDSLGENDLVTVGTDVSCFYIKKKIHTFPDVITLSYCIIINDTTRDDSLFNNSLVFGDGVTIQGDQFLFFCASSPRICDAEDPVIINNDNVTLHFISISYEIIKAISLQSFLNQKLQSKSELSNADEVKRFKNSPLMKKHLIELTKFPAKKLRSKDPQVLNDEAKNNESVITGGKDVNKIRQKSTAAQKGNANSSVSTSSNKRGNPNNKDNKGNVKKQRIIPYSRVSNSAVKPLSILSSSNADMKIYNSKDFHNLKGPKPNNYGGKSTVGENVAETSYWSAQEKIIRENHELSKKQNDYMFYNNIETAAQDKLAHSMKMNIVEQRTYDNQLDDKMHARARDSEQTAINNRREDNRIQVANRREDEQLQFNRDLDRESHATTQRLRLMEMEFRLRGQDNSNNLKLVECNNNTRLQMAAINKQAVDESVSNHCEANDTVEDFEFGPSEGD